MDFVVLGKMIKGFQDFQRYSRTYENAGLFSKTLHLGSNCATPQKQG